MRTMPASKYPLRRWFLLLLVTSGIAACQGSASPTSLPTRLQSIQAAGKLIVGTSTTAPFEYRQPSGSNLIGFDVDLINKLANRLNVKVEWKEMAFADLLDSLQANKVDLVIAALYITDERKKLVDFSQPYLDSGLVMVVQSNNQTILTSKDLAGKVVGVKENATGDKWAQMLRDQQGIRLEIRRYERTVDSLDDLNQGLLDAVFNDQLNTLYYIQTHPNVKMVGDVLSPAWLGIAFRKGDTNLKSFVDLALSDLKKSGELQQLRNKWITPANQR